MQKLGGKGLSMFWTTGGIIGFFNEQANRDTHTYTQLMNCS